MAKEKRQIKYGTCKGLVEINGVGMDKNPSHQVSKSTLTSSGICRFCRGVLTSMNRWYGKEIKEEDG